MRVWFFWFLGSICLFAEDFSLTIEGLEDEVLVSLPEGHDSSKSWPAIFYYHGTNGRPRTDIIRFHTKGRDWIVVGMGYAQRGRFQLTPEGMAAEVKVLRQVRDELEKRVGLDPLQIYVSGFSKGGWMSGLLLQQERSLAGGAILGAGHLHQLQNEPKPLPKNFPVFIGVGREDGNYPLGLKALVFFRKLGAKVEMEVWRGLGHDFPDKGSPGLKEWLALRLDKEPDLDALEVELGVIAKIENDFERWWRLMEFSERPFVKAAHEGWSLKVDALRNQVEERSEIQREMRILKESRRLLAWEVDKKTLKDLEEILAGYTRIVKSAAQSPQGEVAAKDYERLSEILALARAEYGEPEQAPKREEIEVKPDTERRRVPWNPLVR